MRGVRDGEGPASAGFCWVDLLLAMAIAAMVAALAVPLTARSLDAARVRDAAGFVSTQIRAARQHAQASARATAVVFDQTGGGWALRTCLDGNANGVRRADITTARDPCPEGPWNLAVMFPGIVVDVDPAIPGPDGEPGSADPVRFGRSNMASCTSGGGCTAGTVFLRSRSGEQYAIRVGGVTGRTRMLRFDRGTRRWVTG